MSPWYTKRCRIRTFRGDVFQIYIFFSRKVMISDFWKYNRYKGFHNNKKILNHDFFLKNKKKKKRKKKKRKKLKTKKNACKDTPCML